jgi:hypothetical protein
VVAAQVVSSSSGDVFLTILEDEVKQGLRKLPAFLCLLVLALTVVVAPAAFGQAETGTINGTVTDQSGAVLPKARVEVHNSQTGAVRQLETDTNGFYSASNLLPGLYSISVEAPNLAKKEARAQVTVGARVELNFQLTVGTAVTTIEVSSEGGVAVNTETATIGTVVDAQLVNQLPTVNRNPYTFAANVGTASDSDPSGRGVGVSFNGLRSAGTNVLLDGAANNDEFTASVGQTIPLDSVAEYSVLTNNFTAEYGRASSGVVNLATKSGSNAFHGSAYEYNRVSALSSNSFFDNANGNAKAPFTRNIFGGSAGGPIKKNKLFFFGNAEWNRVRSSANNTDYIVDPAFVALANANTQGYFSTFGKLRDNARLTGDVITLGGSGKCTSGTCAGLNPNTPFLDRVAYSTPSDSGAGSPQNQNLVVGRVDWNVSDKTTVYARYALNRDILASGTVSNSAYTGYDTGENIQQNNMLVSMTHSFNSRFTSQSKLVFNRLNDFQPLGSAAISPGLYFNPTTTTTFNGIDVMLPGYLPLTPGNGIPFGGPQNFVQAYEDLSYVKGKHTFRFGGSYDYQRDNRTFGAYETPVAAFSTSGSIANASINRFLNGTLGTFTAAINPQGQFPCPFPITPGQPCTDPSTGQIAAVGNVTTPVGQPVFARSNRYHEFAGYLMDSWKASRKLTLSLGVRWEYFGIQHNKNPELDSNFYLGSGGSLFSQIRNGSVALTGNSPIGGLWAKDWNNFAPKLGFAYDVTGNGKTVVRGGYSVAYERNFGNVTFNVIQNPPNYAVINLQDGVDVPAGGIPVTTDPAGPLAGSGTVKALPKVSLRAVNPNIRTSYAHLYSLTIEHQFAHNLVVGVDYSGSYGEKLYDIANVNKPGQGNVSLGDSCTAVSKLDAFNGQTYTIPAYPCFNSVTFNDGSAKGFTVSKNQLTRLVSSRYSSINFRGDSGKSHYNALVARVGMKNLSNTGLSLNANYTYAHTLDELSDTFSSSGNQFNLGYLNAFNPKTDYGNSYLDLRGRFALEAVWETPFAKNMHGIARQVLHGWTVAPIFTAETGSPFSIYDCTNAVTVCMYAVNAAGTSGIPRAHSGPLVPTGSADNFEFIPFTNTDSSFVNPIAGVSDFGPYPAGMNARNAFRGPGQWNLDVGVYKSFTITERYKLTLRSEFYNALNHANLLLQGGDADVSGGSFIDAFKNGRRTLQLAIRLEF